MKAFVVLLLACRIAHAYPQYQLARDATCTGCHLAPDGGGLLNENGLVVAESTAWKDGDGSFMFGMRKPAWLSLGGDLRGATGAAFIGEVEPVAFPMQAEVAANASSHGFTLHAVGGLRSPQDQGSPLHVLWSREHYVMWQSGSVYLRAGRFEPTYGLRLAEHVDYTQRYGGRPLFGEVYGVAASYVAPSFEIHATGYVHDSLTGASVEHGDGAAAYGEVRVGDHAAIGVEGKISTTSEITKSYGGITAKLYLQRVDVMLQGEIEVIRDHVHLDAGDRVTQFIGYVLASKELGAGLLLDVGAGHFTEDTRAMGLDRDCLDANLHWFVTPHLEGSVTTRLELIDRGSGGRGGYALLQAHYRL
ncbi:MAG: hypothetical protein NT062_29560 [Proteobacteria bacterium]|nr:hypothetical protein [Pseudomonadota bacterium]